MWKLILKSIIDGLFRGLTFFFIVNVYISTYANAAPIPITILIGILIAVMHGAVFFLLFRNEEGRNILISCITGEILTFLSFACCIILPFRLPLREVNVGDGLIIMGLAPVIIGLSVAARYLISLPLIKKKNM